MFTVSTVRVPREEIEPRWWHVLVEHQSFAIGQLLQLVQNLRPAWLRVSRGLNSFSSPQDVVVFRNGLRMGGRDALSSIPVATIVRIRMYSATEARQKFGGETSGGAIDVTTR